MNVLDAEMHFYKLKILKISNFEKQAWNVFKTSRYGNKLRLYALIKFKIIRLKKNFNF